MSFSNTILLTFSAVLLASVTSAPHEYIDESLLTTPTYHYVMVKPTPRPAKGRFFVLPEYAYRAAKEVILVPEPYRAREDLPVPIYGMMKPDRTDYAEDKPEFTYRTAEPQEKVTKKEGDGYIRFG